MAGERQFFLHREDAHADAALFLQRRLARQNERGFREVHLPGYGLHFRICQSPAIEENCQRIARKTTGGKYIQLHEGAPRFCCHGDVL